MARPFSMAHEFLALQPSPPVVVPTQPTPMPPMPLQPGPMPQMAGQPGQMMLPGQMAIVQLPSQKLVDIESENLTDVRAINFELNGSRLPNGATVVEPVYIKEEWQKEP